MRPSFSKTLLITVVCGGTMFAAAQTKPASDSADMAPTIVVTATDDVQPKRIGGGVSAPVLLHSANPQYSDEARKEKASGNVLVNLWMDQDGSPSHFIEKNGMTWPQYRDGNGSLRLAYGVTAIPQFFTIDTDGVLQSVKVGSNADVESDIRRMVKKATEAEKKKAMASDHAAAGL